MIFLRLDPDCQTGFSDGWISAIIASMKQLNFKDRWVVITGASAGLGAEMARYLAVKEKANLVLAARREDRMLALKEQLLRDVAVKIEVAAVDLTTAEGCDGLFRKATAVGKIYALINNAGMTTYGKTSAEHIGMYQRIIDLNVRAVMHLSLLFLEYFQVQGEGAILNVTSEAAFTPTPYQNVYAASKHAIQSFTDCLRVERRDRRVKICTFVPGGINTDMISDSGLSAKVDRDSFVNMKPDVAARKAVEAFKRGKPMTIPGILNKVNHALMWALPRRLKLVMSERFYRPPQ